jgi:phosphatidate phosphatase PAH1
MDLFPVPKKAITMYQAEAIKVNEHEENQLKEVEKLQENHTKLLLEKENSLDLSEKIYLNLQAREIVREVEEVNVILEELAQEKAALKLSVCSYL